MLRRLYYGLKEIDNRMQIERLNKTIKFSNPIFRKEKNIVKPLLIVCGPGFDQESPIAGSLMRIGFARGWAEKFGYAKLISVFELEKELNEHDNPAIFLCVYDYTYINKRVLNKLRSVDSFVWASIHPRKLSEFEKRILIEENAKDLEIWINNYSKIMYSEPKFVWNSACSETMYWYQGWVDDGLNWQIIHPAVDVIRYYPEKNIPKFGEIKIGYVGGYWIEKAQAFDLYFRKIEEIFTPFGYNKWPYKNYGGRLNEQSERQLYSTCGIIPLVTSPAGWLMGEITERYLKGPGCKGFCIADQNIAVREIFTQEEILQAESAEHFHDIVREVFVGNINTEQWRNAGYEAVLKKHLYSHRAEQIMNALTNKK